MKSVGGQRTPYLGRGVQVDSTKDRTQAHRLPGSAGVQWNLEGLEAFRLFKARKADMPKTMTHTLLLYCLVLTVPTESRRTLSQVRKGRWEDELAGGANGK